MTFQKNKSKLTLNPFPKESQEGVWFKISSGRDHFNSAKKLMGSTFLLADGSQLKKNDGSIWLNPDHICSALILFQFSFELLLKALLQLKHVPAPKKGWDGHDLIKLLDMASEYFPDLKLIEQENRNILSELSSGFKDENGKHNSKLMGIKYGMYCISLPNHQDELLKSFLNIFQSIDNQIRIFCPQS